MGCHLINFAKESMNVARMYDIFDFPLDIGLFAWSTFSQKSRNSVYPK